MMGLWKKSLIVMVLGIAALFLQGTVLSSILPAAAVPCIIFVLTIFLAFNEPSIAGVFLAFALGLLLDMSSGFLLGPWAGAYVIVFGVLASLSQRLFIDSWMATAVVVFLSSLSACGIFLLMIIEFREPPVSTISFSLATSAVTALVSPLCFSFFKWLLAEKESGLYGLGR